MYTFDVLSEVSFTNICKNNDFLFFTMSQVCLFLFCFLKKGVSKEKQPVFSFATPVIAIIIT